MVDGWLQSCLFKYPMNIFWVHGFRTRKRKSRDTPLVSLASISHPFAIFVQPSDVSRFLPHSFNISIHIRYTSTITWGTVRPSSQSSYAMYLTFIHIFNLDYITENYVMWMWQDTVVSKFHDISLAFQILLYKTSL